MHLQDLEGGAGPREDQVVDRGAEAQAAAAAAEGNAQHCQDPYGRCLWDKEGHCRSQSSILRPYLFIPDVRFLAFRILSHGQT